MKVNNIASTNFGVNVRIKSADNKKHQFLYNEIEQLRKDYRIPVNFKTHEIELPSVSVNILKVLNELKIRFYSGKKH